MAGFCNKQAAFDVSYNNHSRFCTLVYNDDRKITRIDGRLSQ